MPRSLLYKEIEFCRSISIIFLQLTSTKKSDQTKIYKICFIQKSKYSTSFNFNDANHWNSAILWFIIIFIHVSKHSTFCYCSILIDFSQCFAINYAFILYYSLLKIDFFFTKFSKICFNKTKKLKAKKRNRCIIKSEKIRKYMTLQDGNL